MHWYSPFLYPFSMLYEGVTASRNWMFDKGFKRQSVFSVPTVVVGNLNIGGSGKTPMVEYLINLFQDKYHLATLSRGYGRKSRGFFLANEQLGPKEIGDEPYQIYSKFGDKVAVSVGEDRVMAIPEIMALKPETELILLDDAFQHRYVKGDLNILLTTFQKPFFKDQVLPLGTLRENKHGAKRADLVVITKTPQEIDQRMREEYILSIQKFTHAKICFASLRYGDPYPLNLNFSEERRKIVLVSGIANDALLFEEASKRFEVTARLNYGDHHHYSKRDAEKIRFSLGEAGDAMVLTTEKDAVKLKNSAFHEYLSEIPIFVLPIQVKLDMECQLWLKRKVESIVAEKSRISES